MKNKYLIHVLSLVAIMFVAFQYAESQTPKTQNSKDFAIMVHTTISENPLSITLHWPLLTDAQEFEVSRKLKTENSWQVLATLDSGTTEYVDNTVKDGIAYEYQILGKSQMYIKVNDTTNSYMPYYSTGYAYAGINAPPPFLGKILLIVEEELSSNISEKIARLESDMQAEGWTTLRKYAPRTERFDGAAVKAVKNIILEEYNKDPNNLTTVLLLGRIAVPYSGDFKAVQGSTYPPDGHPDHAGAWPADVYYGLMNESFWTDKNVNNTIGNREENKNIIADGKFDQISFQNENVTLKIGRVDLYNMPFFYDSTTQEGTELDLISNYLDKNHNYRSGKVNYVNKGIIVDGFSTMQEGFASSGWRNFGTFFSADSVVTGNWIQAPDTTKNYLWSYACAGGWYEGCGVGTTLNMVANPIHSIFTLMFGSYFGDWDHSNAFLRAPLASKPTALTCAWSGRPHWYMHLMGLGEPIGSAYLQTANNTQTANNYSTYMPNLYYNINYGGWFIYASGMKNIHIALMGDPTLKMNYSYIEPPKNLVLNQIEKRKLQLSWDASSDKEAKYFVYRAKESPTTNVMSKYTLLNKEPMITTSFVDSTIVNGNLQYKVIAVKLQNTIGSGSYYTQSAEIIDNTTITSVDEMPELDFNLSATPNPADENSEITFGLSKTAFADLTIFDISGNIVLSLYNNFVSAGTQYINWNLTDTYGNKVPSGVYFIKLSSDGLSKIEKLIIR